MNSSDTVIKGVKPMRGKRIDWLIYPLSYFLPADPHSTSWTYIDRRGTVVALRGRD